LGGGGSTSGVIEGVGSLRAGVAGFREGLGRVHTTKLQHFTPVESTLRRVARACYYPCSGQLSRQRLLDS